MKWLVNLFKFLFGGGTEGETGSSDESGGGTESGGGSTVMNKKAVCIGINDYPGTKNDLAGCINDCNSWAGVLGTLGFNVSKLQNSQATKQGVKDALSGLVSNAKSGDVLVFTYSGHGSFVVDMSSPKPDHKNETLYTYDGNVFDYEIRAIMDGLPEGVSMTVILDSCHSGTATRVARPDAPKPRFMPPNDPAMAALGNLPTARRVFIPESQMKEVLFSGCKATEYSYDAKIGGVPAGAFSYYAVAAVKKNGSATCKQVHDEIRKSLPSNNHPQTPGLEGSDTNKARQIFT